jgi:hypothetical protein
VSDDDPNFIKSNFALTTTTTIDNRLYASHSSNSVKSLFFKSEENELEDFAVIWYSVADNKIIEQKLYYMNDYVITFDEKEACLDFIRKEKRSIFLIVSGTLAENFVPIIYELRQIVMIYIFCIRQADHELWTRQYRRKIGGIFLFEYELNAKVLLDILNLIVHHPSQSSHLRIKQQKKHQPVI